MDAVRREPHGEGASYPHLAFHFYLSAMSLSDMAAYCQAQTRASLGVRAGFINSVESFEDERYVFCWDANPCIRDGDDHHFPFATK
jgi:hypothetical protein